MPCSCVRSFDTWATWDPNVIHKHNQTHHLGTQGRRVTGTSQETSLSFDIVITSREGLLDLTRHVHSPGEKHLAALLHVGPASLRGDQLCL